VFRLDDEAENNEANRRQVCIDFVRYLNEDVQWRFPQSFRFVSDETVVVNGKIGKIDRYMLNSDIAGYVGKYVFESSPQEVLASDELMNEVFENPQNMLNAPDFFPRFWDSWSQI
jgi:hypothetical protein